MESGIIEFQKVKFQLEFKLLGFESSKYLCSAWRGYNSSKASMIVATSQSTVQWFTDQFDENNTPVA